jgi:hypothetical protein
MAKIIWPADKRVWKDNGDPATDGTVSVRLGGTATPQAAYTNIDLNAGEAASFSLASDGYLANNDTLYVSDSVTVDLVIQATGFNGSLPLTIPNVAIADTTIAGDTDVAVAFKNALVNGGLDAWTGATSFSNISGDGVGVEVADDWYFAQPNAAANAVSRQTAQSVGARYGLRFGRPAASSSTNPLRLWAMLPTDAAYRLGGRTLTVSVTAVAGADFSGGGLSVRLATGTGEGQSGDLIASSGFTGHSNVIDEAQAITTAAVRYEFSAGVLSNIGEVGLQFSYTPTGTAGSNDWIQIEDVQIESADEASAFSAPPEVIEFLRANLSTLSRTLLKQTTAAGMTDALGALPLTGNKTMTGLFTLSGDPTSALHPATKQYADTIAAGFKVKANAAVATTEDITLSGEQTIDGVLTSASRVLVKDQSAPAENGIYVSAAGAWARATDMDHWDEVPASLCFVEDGSTNADTLWLCSSAPGGTLGTTAIEWQTFLPSGAYQPHTAELDTYQANALTSAELQQLQNIGANAISGAQWGYLAASTAYGGSLMALADAAAARVAVGLDASANGISLITAANYAAMRALLDLEAGTDFLSPAAIAAAYQPLDGDLTSIAALTTTSFGRGLLTETNAGTLRTTAGLVIGTDVQAHSARLGEIAALTPTDSNIIVGNGSAWVAESGATARTSLGLGTGDSPAFTAVSASNGAAASTPAATFTNTTDNAGVQVAQFHGDRATPAANDEAWVSYYMSDAAGNQEEVGRHSWYMTSVTNGSETSRQYFWTKASGGSITRRWYFDHISLQPFANDGLALGAAAQSWSDLYLASGGVINWANGNATLTHSSGLLASSVPVQAAVAAVTGVSGTLTTAHRNVHCELNGNVTMPNSVFTAQDKQTFDPGTSARTFTRGSGVTMYVNGADSASATLAANQMGGAHWRTASVVVLCGAFS